MEAIDGGRKKMRGRDIFWVGEVGGHGYAAKIDFIARLGEPISFRLVPFLTFSRH